MAASYDDATRWKIEHSGRIDASASKAVAGFFCGFAILAACGRITVRLTIRRRLFLDDFVLLFALASLLAATGMFYKFHWLIYVLNILKYDTTVMVTASDLKDIMNAQAINYSLMALMWSAICPVKLCFLVSFKVLTRNVSRLIVVWYWCTVCLVIIIWGLMIALSFIECPYTGAKLLQHCTPETPYNKTIAGYWLAFITDAATDIMIVAIPIYILRHVRLKLTQKLAIAAFLCLSIFMIIASLVRLCLSRYRGWGDLTLQYLLIYMEACIAITMASVAAYRTVFVEFGKKKESEQQKLLVRQREQHAEDQVREMPASYTLHGRIRQIRELHNSADNWSASNSSRTHTAYIDGPTSTGPKLNSVLSFIRGVGRTKNDPTVDSGMGLNTLDSASLCIDDGRSQANGNKTVGRASGST